MQEIEAAQERQQRSTRRRPLSGRWVFLGSAACALLLLAVLPPLVSVNRYQRRISTSIGASLGRPVHFDHVALNLIPLPGFTITNFVVEEDPSFGAEPIIRANSVTATLRVSSLWRRRVEFSRISFSDPSVNLVHDASGRWNVAGILLQAAHIETDPTSQRTAGSRPRFPYIEASGARLNLKQGSEKTPFSLTEADFALWQPDPLHWNTRIQGRPVRTDTSASDTGTLQMEATLGRSASLQTVPLDLQLTWRGAPLGEATRVILGRDMDLRGELTLSGAIHGSLSENSLQTRLQINGLRRADFVPAQTVSVDLQCTGAASRAFHAFTDVRCSWPVPDSDGATLALAGSLPDVLQPRSADMEIGVARLPATVLLNWLRVTSTRVPDSLSAIGLLSGSIAHTPGADPAWVGEGTIPDLHLAGAAIGSTPLVLNGIFLHTSDAASSAPPASGPPLPESTVTLSPLAIPLGGKLPATLDGTADATGYTLHLSGTALLSRLAALGSAVPQFGEGLPAILPATRIAGPVRLDISAHRTWGGAQVWIDNLAAATTPHPPRSSPRRRSR